jgi:hypothetical protein
MPLYVFAIQVSQDSFVSQILMNAYLSHAKIGVAAQMQ